MYDSYPNHHNNENEQKVPNVDTIGTILFDTSCLPQFQNNYRALSDIAKEGPLEETLKLAGYPKGDIVDEVGWDDDTLPFVRIGLMTPNYIESQVAVNKCGREYAANKNDNSKKTELRGLLKELVDYHAVLREVIELNPHFGAKRLANFLQGDAMWMDMPESYRKQAEIQVSRAINGTRAEIIVKRTIKSPVMEKYRIAYHQTDTQEDIWGIDCVADVTFGKGNEQMVVNLPIDVKAASDQVVQVANSRNALKTQSPAYAFKDNAIVIYNGIDLNSLYDSLLPDAERIDENAERMGPLLRMAAQDYYRAVQKAQVARYMFPVAA